MGRVEPNQAGIQRMLTAPFMVAAMQRLGEKVQARAAQISAAEAVDTGRYAASWRVTTFVNGNRAVARVHNRARSPEGANYPVFLEFGWRTRSGRHMPARRILARSIDAIRI